MEYGMWILVVFVPHRNDGMIYIYKHLVSLFVGKFKR